MDSRDSLEKENKMLTMYTYARKGKEHLYMQLGKQKSIEIIFIHFHIGREVCRSHILSTKHKNVFFLFVKQLNALLYKSPYK